MASVLLIQKYMSHMTTESNQNCDYQNIVIRKFDLAKAGLPSSIIKYVTEDDSQENTHAMVVGTNISCAYRSYTI